MAWVRAEGGDDERTELGGGVMATYVESIRVDTECSSKPEVLYGNLVGFTRGRITYRAEIVLRSDDREWIDRLMSYLNGETDVPPARDNKELPSAVKSLPQGPIDGVLEDE
jgi:hypothetical protein